MSLKYKHTQKNKQKISEALKKQWALGIRKGGWKHSKATKKKMSESRIGHYISKETREKISKAVKGNKNKLGYKTSEETKKKIRESNIGQKRSKETCEKISKALKGLTGEKSRSWRGGITKNHSGYIFIHQPNHPFCENRGYVRRARLVIEGYIGRYLTKEEQAHHINGIVDDDRVENLYLFSSNSEHKKYHGNQYMKPKPLLKSNLKKIKGENNE